MRGREAFFVSSGRFSMRPESICSWFPQGCIPAVSYRNVVDWSTIIIGLVVLVNTEIISQATAIKDENDLTI